MGISRFKRWHLFFTLCLAILFCLNAPNPAHAAKNKILVQKKVAKTKIGSTIDLTFKKPNTAGNLLVVFLVWDNAGAASVGDTAGNTFTSAAGPTFNGGHSAQIFFAPGIAGGADTITATFTTPIATLAVLYAHEYSGTDQVSPLDGAIVASGFTNSMDSGSVSTTNTGELLFLGAESDGAVSKKIPGYKARAHKFGNLTADKIAGAPGSYNATGTQTGTSWIMQLAAFKVAGFGPSAAYPLKVSTNGRYLVDQNNVPFLITGDSPQALMVNLSEADADSFFADRQAAGFNAVWINLLCATYTGGRADASTYDGIIPFTTPGDISTPNEAYFARVDDMLRLAAKHGLAVWLDPAETGSFLSVLNNNGVTKSRDYGRYLGNRYKDFDNIVWMSGNDFQTWSNSGDDAVVQAVARGIQDNDTRHIHTVELNYSVSGSLDDDTWAPLIQLNASYTYFPTYAEVLKDYDRPNAIATFMVEANYEFEHNASDEGTPEILRRQEYWTLLSGAAGQLYGNHYTWPFATDWQSHLDTTGSTQMGYVRSLFEARRWFDLIPDENHNVVISGYGTFSDSGSLESNDYVTAARTADGTLVMAYMPTIRTIRVDMTKLSAAANASWYDPTIGVLIPIAGSPFPNTGTHDFTPAGNNTDGDGDWILVLETN